LNSKNIGSHNSSEYNDVEKFLAELADRKPTADEIVHSAAGWGALEELRYAAISRIVDNAWC
jgi:hypothetical protein